MLSTSDAVVAQSRGTRRLTSDVFSYLGIIIMALLIAVIVVAGAAGMRQIKNTGDGVVRDRIEKIILVQNMHRASRERTVLLQRIVLVDDPFERDALMLEFNNRANQFSVTRAEFIAKGISAEEQRILEAQGASHKDAAPLQNKILDLVGHEHLEEARQVLNEKERSLQDNTQNLMSELLKYQTDAAQHAVDDTRDDYETGIAIIFTVAVIAGLVAVVLIWLVHKSARIRADYLAQVETANRAKSAFLAKMSHEMRTPLTAIIGFAEASLDSGQTMDERITALRIIQQSGSHLLHIINDILDLSKIEAEKLEVDPCECSLFSILNDVHALVQMQAQSKHIVFGINYAFPLPAHIYTDPLRLKQIVINLCGNALKFTEQGFVYINVGFDRANGLLTIAVQDSGIGLTTQEQSRLFQDFHQADAGVQRKYGGTGLGLALSQKLAAMLGGKISLTSETGVGSTFTLELAQPAAVRELVFVDSAALVPVGAPQTSAVLEARHLSGRVLCAEDTPELAELIGLLLRRIGLTTVMVENGAQAVERAARERFDLIFMDIQMPVLDGVAAMIKLKESGCDIPVVAVTANAMKEDQEHYRAAGFADFLAKPIDRSQLQRLLETYLPAAEPTDPPDSGPIHAEFSDAADAADQYLRRIVESFVDRLPGYCEQLTQAIASRQWTQAREVAHQLRGLGGGMGYPIVTELASTLLFQLKTENYAEVEHINARLGDVAERIQLGKSR